MTLEIKIDELIKSFQKAQKEFFESIDSKISGISKVFDQKILDVETQIDKLNKKIVVYKSKELTVKEYYALVDEVSPGSKDGRVESSYSYNESSAMILVDHSAEGKEPLFKFMGSEESKLTFSYQFSSKETSKKLDFSDVPSFAFIKAGCKIYASPGVEVIRELDPVWISCPAKVGFGIDPGDGTAQVYVVLENSTPSFIEKNDFKPLKKEYSIYGFRLNSTFLI